MNNQSGHNAKTDVDRRLRALADAIRGAIPHDQVADAAALRDVFIAANEVPPGRAQSQPEPFFVPRHRTIIAVDVEASTTRTNVGRMVLRNAMYDLIDNALLASGVSGLDVDKIDRGDGVIMLIRPVDHVPTTRVLTDFVPNMGLLLNQSQDVMDRSFRMRVALHTGEAHSDGRGWYGEDIDLACRLLDAPEVKRKLKQTSAPLVLAVSDHFYRSIIQHGYDGIDRTTFEPIVRVAMGRLRHRGWVQIVGGQDIQSGASAG